MANAVTYLRVSGDSQIAGDGFPRQREICLKYASERSLQIVSEFRDEGVTGKMELEGRSGLSACLQYVREHGIGIVIVESSDRLARDMIVAEVIIREFQKIGVKVISASGGVDLTEGNDANPTAKLIRQILAAVAEFDRCVIVLKLRGARERKRIANGGKCEGRSAFGTKPGEKETLSTMLNLKAAGKSAVVIADILNLRGIETRGTVKHGKGQWKAGTVHRILARNSVKS